VQRLRVQGRYVDLGLGNYPRVKLAVARKLASDNKLSASEGKSPKQVRRVETSTPTFSELANKLLEIKEQELSNAKHKAQWRSTLEKYVIPKLGDLPVDQIEVEDVLTVLNPIWRLKTETADRVRQRIEAVLNYASSSKFREGPNPAMLKGNLEFHLPKKSQVQKRENMPALQLDDAPRWWGKLKKCDGNGSLALMFLTLTASRSGEVRGMTWEEIKLFSDKEKKENKYLGDWTIPASRMKMRQEHVVPITKEMLKIIESSGTTSGLVFASQKGMQLSDMTLSQTMKRINASDANGFLDKKTHKPAVPHGLRSTFRDWASVTKQSREAAEIQLSHKFGSSMELVYRRDELLMDRAEMLERWYDFLEHGS
jgi:integrase